MATAIGTVAAIKAGNAKNPILKLETCSRVNSTQRHKGLLSDGEGTIRASFTSDLFDAFSGEDSIFKVGSTIQLDDYILNYLDGIPVLQVQKCRTADLIEGTIETTPTKQTVKREREDENGNCTEASKSLKTDGESPQPIKHEDLDTNTPILRETKSTTRHITTPESTTKLETPKTPQVGPSMSKRRITPISGLNPYMGNWVIKARVTRLGNLRTFSGRGGREGSVFDCDFTDEAGSAIQASFFNEEARKFHPVLKENNLYYVSRGHLKPANYKYAVVKNDYQLMISRDTEIEEVPEHETPSKELFREKHELLQITELPRHFKRNRKIPVDVMGIVLQVGEVGSIQRKRDGSSVYKRDVQICDTSNHKVSLTLWGDHAENLAIQADDVISAQKISVGDYQGCSLNTIPRSVVEVNPDVEEAKALTAWWKEQGSKTELIPIGSVTGTGSPESKARTNDVLHIKELEERTLGTKPMYFTIRGTVFQVLDKKDIWYNACPEDGVNAKVTESNGQWWCEKTGKHYDTFKRRYVAPLVIGDFTGKVIVTAFNDQMEQILKMSADELADIKESNNTDYNSKIRNKCFENYTFQVKAVEEEYNGESRRRVAVSRLTPINYVEESKKILQSLTTTAAP